MVTRIELKPIGPTQIALQPIRVLVESARLAYFDSFLMTIIFSNY